MKKKENSIIAGVVLGVVLLLLTIGCELTPTTVTLQSVIQSGGTSTTADSTALILSFDKDPSSLTVNDITVTGATKGVLSGSGLTRSLTISNITVSDGETVSVSITNPDGFSINDSSKAAIVYKELPVVTFESVIQSGGTSTTADSTALILSFDKDPSSLTVNDITVTGATKGVLSGSGLTRSLTISNITVSDGETVSVSITNPDGFSINDSSKAAIVYKELPVVTFESVIQSGGTSTTADSTALILSFDKDPSSLTVNDITVTGATKGVLSGSGLTRSLTISNITVSDGETVSVSITNPDGFSINDSSKAAIVYKELPVVTFESVIQSGGTSTTADSTALILSFDKDPSSLTVNDITVTGATKGVLSGSGLTRSLTISNITVSDGETVTVSITNPDGFSINDSSKAAIVYKELSVVVTFERVIQSGGTTTTTDSTALILSFDKDPSSLTVNDITVTGATKGVLSGSGLTRSLTISNITVSDGETVSVSITNPDGFSINDSSKTAIVYRAPYVGLEYQGGIVAYIFKNNDQGYIFGETHGLIVAKADQSDGIVWISGNDSSIVSTSTGDSSDDMGSGYANTLAMINQEYYTGGAAQVCVMYNSSGYNDWFLPSYDELLELYRNRDSIGGFISNEDSYMGSYWSSSESGSSTVKIKHFSGNSITHTSKYIPSVRVRAVRYF